MDLSLLKTAFSLIATAKAMNDLFEEKREVTGKYVHATSRGHEAVQIALGLQLTPHDYLSAYYRDDSLLLAIGMTPYELMLQLLAKAADPFSGGRCYYSHPSLNRFDMPKIPHQSSATGMQAIPLTGVALGIHYKHTMKLWRKGENPIAVCSMGDAAVTEGEVAEAFQMAVLKRLPVLYLVQDNGWDISAKKEETRAMNAFEYAKGFNGMTAFSIDGTSFPESFATIRRAIAQIRVGDGPVLIHAEVPLLGHHTSGVRMEMYRDDLAEAQKRDPYPRLKQVLTAKNVSQAEISQMETVAAKRVRDDFERAKNASDPEPADLYTHDFAPTEIEQETGTREPANEAPTVMIDSALSALREILETHPEALVFGQDVGRRLGGVFRETANLAEHFGDHRVFNTPIQEAFILGSTCGLSAVGLKPIVEVQFADYIWPALNQVFTEMSRSCYLSNGKWPVSAVIRVPIGAYGSGGPSHSSSIESVLVNIRGIKVVYPSTGADLKGLLKAAFYDPNPVFVLEHKGLYWSKVPGTGAAKTAIPSRDYIIPLGLGKVVEFADEKWVQSAQSVAIITYGRGVYWALGLPDELKSRCEIIDLRSLAPLDENLIFESVRRHGKCLILTEEPESNSFAQALAGRVQKNCFETLDAPIEVLGAKDLPAIPLNETLEAEMLPSTNKLEQRIKALLRY
jgi:2-oxoisovalerate dehydrogenase E1 component